MGVVKKNSDHKIIINILASWVSQNIVFYSCKKSYLYQSSLKKHFLVSHEVEYTKYLSEKKSKLPL